MATVYHWPSIRHPNSLLSSLRFESLYAVRARQIYHPSTVALSICEFLLATLGTPGGWVLSGHIKVILRSYAMILNCPK